MSGKILDFFAQVLHLAQLEALAFEHALRALVVVRQHVVIGDGILTTFIEAGESEGGDSVREVVPGCAFRTGASLRTGANSAYEAVEAAITVDTVAGATTRDGRERHQLAEATIGQIRGHAGHRLAHS